MEGQQNGLPFTNITDKEGTLTDDDEGTIESSPLQTTPSSKQLDDILSDLKFGKFHYKMLVLTCGAYFAACSEMMLIVFLSGPIKEEWDLGDMLFPVLPFCSGIFSLAGSFVFGSISDKFGRQKPLLVALILMGLFGLASAFTPSFVVFVAARALTTFGTSGIEAIDFVLLLEFLPKKNRGSIMVVITFCGALGAVYSAGIAWLLLPNYGWRWFVGVCTVPAILVLAYRLVFNYESPRYLYVSKKTSEGLRVLQEIAKQNGAVLTDEEIVCPPSPDRGRIQDLFSRELRMTTIFASCVWFCQSMGYWSVTMYLPEYMSTLGIDPYFNTFTVFIGELPGMCLAMILIEPHMFGRIKCLRFFSFFTAASLLVFAFVPFDFLKAVFVIVVYFCMVPIYSILNTFTPEVYPTNSRSIAMAWVYMVISFPGLISAFLGASVLSTNITWLYPTVAAGFFVTQLLCTFGLRVEPAGKGLKDCKPEQNGTSSVVSGEADVTEI